MKTSNFMHFNKIYKYSLKLTSKLGVVLLAGLIMTVTHEISISQNTGNGDVVVVQHLSRMIDVSKNEQNLITMDVSNMQLSEALEILAKKAKVGISYNTEIIPKKEVTLNMKDVPVHIVLYQLLEGTGLESVLPPSRDVIVIRDKEETIEEVYQDIIRGAVTDAQTGESLPGVNIIVEGTTTGTSTDVDGNFELNVSSLEETLIFTYVGYERQEVSIDGRVDLNIEMQTQELIGDEIVVVGYQQMAGADISGSVSTVSAEDIVRRPVPQLSQALQGKVPGVAITQNFSPPGNDDATIRIRGVGTLGNANPLVLIDGIPGNLNDITPQDVENISVLKDASSASIYGSRAANGVVLVTTKRGQEGIAVEYGGYGGNQYATNIPDMMDAMEYMQYWNDRGRNQNTPPQYSEAYLQEYRENIGSELYPDVDWFDAVLQPGFQQGHNLTLSSGSETIRTLASVSYMNQDGIAPTHNFERYSLRVNSDFQASEKLSFALNTYFNRGNRVIPAENQNALWELVWRTPANAPVMMDNGNYGEGKDADENALAFMEAGGTETVESNEIKLNLISIYEISDNFEVEASYAHRNLNSDLTHFSKSYEYQFKSGGMALAPGGRNELIRNFDVTEQNNYRALLRYNGGLGNHNLNGLLGMEAIDEMFEFTTASREALPLTEFPYLSTGSDAFKDNSGGASEGSLLSYFGRIDYNYDNRYLLQANLRYDGSSRFATGNQWGAFPSISVGWRLTEENFFPNNSIVTNLKIRASWGQLGNQEIGNYSFTSSVDLSQGYSFNKSSAIGGAIQTLANSGITWESTETGNVGVDFELFGGQLYGAFDFYRKITNDILYIRGIPNIIGLNAPEQNIANVENVGWDLSLGFQQSYSNTSFGVDLVLSDVKNEIKDLGGRNQFSLLSLIEGEEFGAIYGYKNTGIFRTEQELEGAPVQNANVVVGDLRFEDLNGDGDITSADRTVIGSTIPRYTFGIAINVGYRAFELSSFLQGVGKKDGYFSPESEATGFDWQMNYFREGNEMNADYPRPGRSGNELISSYYVWDASYLRIKNLTLRYTLPASLLNRISPLLNASIYVSGENLFTLTDYAPGLDPEAPSIQNTYSGYYPNVKRFVLGINFNF